MRDHTILITMLQTAWALDWLDWLSAFVGVVYDVFLQVRAPANLRAAAISQSAQFQTSHPRSRAASHTWEVFL